MEEIILQSNVSQELINILGGNTLWAILLSLVTFFGAGFMAYKIKKKHPKATFGDIVNFFILREKISAKIIILFLINIAEAAVAASIHPPGQQDPNPVGRFALHLTIAMAGIFCGIYAFNLMHILAKKSRSFVKDKKYFKLTILVVLTISVFSAAAYFPYLNVMLIANGVNQTAICAAFFDVSISDPLPNWEHFKYMKYILASSCAAVIAHYVLLIIDGLYLLYEADEHGMMDSIGGQIETGEDETNDINSTIDLNDRDARISQTKQLIQWLCKRIGYRTDNPAAKKTLEKHVNACVDKMDSMNKVEDQITLINNTKKWKKKFIELDRRKNALKSDDESGLKQWKVDYLKTIKDCRVFFGKTTRNGVGYGTTTKNYDAAVKADLEGK